MATVCPGTRLSGPPKKYTKVLQEGTDWIEIEMVDRESEAIAYQTRRCPWLAPRPRLPMMAVLSGCLVSWSPRPGLESPSHVTVASK
jgi:hypothetical protein